MKNPYYYFYYRLNNFVNKHGNNELGPISAVTFITGQYLLIIYSKVFNLNEVSISEHKFIMIGIVITLYIVNCIIFLSKERVKTINNIFINESVKNRKLRGFLLVLFMLAPLIYILY